MVFWERWNGSVAVQAEGQTASDSSNDGLAELPVSEVLPEQQPECLKLQSGFGGRC